MINLLQSKKEALSKGVVVSSSGSLTFVKDRFSKVQIACFPKSGVSLAEGDEVVFVVREEQAFIVDRYEKDRSYPNSATMATI